jgi:hypothetical protein
MENEMEVILRAVDLMAAERAALTTHGPRFCIHHRFWQPETICTPGEMIAEICLLHRTREISLPLPSRLMLLFDYLARHRHVGQCAAQIAAGLSVDPFSRRHGAYAKAGANLIRGVSRTAVKQQVMRLRSGLGRAFRKAGISLDPRRVVLSERTATNEIRYRLKANVSWEHFCS